MEGVGNKRKKGIELDWGQLLCEEGKNGEEEEPLHLEVVSKNGQLNGPPVTVEPDEEQSQRFESFKDWKEEAILSALNSSKTTLSQMELKLKDGGAKLKNQIKLYEDELERRKSIPVLKDGDECNSPLHSWTKKICNISDDFEGVSPTPLPSTKSSEFASRFFCKMDQKEELCTSKQSDFGKLRSKGISSRDRKKRGGTSKEAPFGSSGSLLVDVGKQMLSCIDKKDGRLAACSNHNSSEDLPSLSTAKSSQVQNLPWQCNKGDPVVLDDEDEIEVKEITASLDDIDNCTDKDSRIYYPSRDDPEAIEIRYTDMLCLDPEAYLSSTIMNFYIGFMWSQILTDQERYNYHFFNTYFYEKLKEAVQAESSKETSFTKFRRWWKGVNLFEKAYILLPIHDQLHWSLVVICIPDREDRLGLVLLHLDSLGLHDSDPIFRNIKKFLIAEWEYLDKREVQMDLPLQDAVWRNFPRRIKQKVLEVPRQGNDYDCGLFVLYFMKRFIEEAPERLKMDNPSNILHKIGRKWFSPLQPSILRQEIRTKLKQLFKEASS